MSSQLDFDTIARRDEGVERESRILSGLIIYSDSLRGQIVAGRQLLPFESGILYSLYYCSTLRMFKNKTRVSGLKETKKNNGILYRCLQKS